jgi:nucleoside-diphosphate-sugar epimerase
MNIVVTGAAGYIGAPAVATLLRDGHSVTGVDCLRFGGSAVLGSYLTRRFSLAAADIRDRDAVVAAVAGADAVIHLAGIVGDPACAAEPDMTRAVNLDATIALHDACRRAGVARFVFASTCSVYGHCAEPADETTAPRPLSLYAQSKADAETAVLQAPSGGTATTVLRFATVYGLAPRMRFDLMINTMVADAVTRRRVRVDAPDAWRPFIHVADAADAIGAVVAMPSAAVAGQVFNVGSPDNWRMADAARLVAGACGPDVRIDMKPRGGDRRDYRISTAKLSAASSWRSARTLRDGITELANVLTAGVLDDHPGAGRPRCSLT